MTAKTQSSRGLYLLLWSVLLAAPIAWSVALGYLLPMTDWVCEHGGRFNMISVAGACLLISLAAIGLGGIGLRQRHHQNGADERSRFMLSLGIWMSALFALVILFYIIPVFVLSPCPL